jgi:small subunit ribosomal protein S6
MRNYEIMVVIQPDLDETTVNGILEKITGWISDAGGVVTKKDVWGKRRLAYSIRKQREGVYVLLNIQILPSKTSELEHNLLLTEPVLRFLITLVE